jgi:hypothetical protein
MEIIRIVFGFVWDMLNIPIHIGDYILTYFSVISFAFVLGLAFKLIFGGGKGE